jgi:effector-binding domain-containing protein
MEEVTVIDVGPLNVVGARRRGAYHDVSKVLPELFKYVFSNGLQMTGPPVYLCHELSMEEVERAMKEGNADLEVVIPVAGKVVEKGDIKAYKIPGGKMAKVVHRGPYEKVGETYGRLFEWMGRNGKAPRGPFREIYLNDPTKVPPEEILTEINVPI